MVLSLEKSPVAVGGELREEYGSLRLSMRDLLLREVSGDAVAEQEEVAALAERVRREAALYPMTRHEAFTRVAGVDAGSQILPLASRQYALISALAYGFPRGRRFFLAPEVFSVPSEKAGSRFKGSVNLRREAKLYETAARFVGENPETQLLLVDGPLAFSDWWQLSGKPRDRARLVDAVRGLLEACREAGVAVAGVVKRPSARYFVFHMGLQAETSLPDSPLLLHALHPGERTDVFSPRAALRQAGRPAGFMDVLGFPVYSFYARTTREWSIPPIRVDLPAHSLASLDDIADYCYATSVTSGIPLPLVKADEEVKVSRRFMAEVYGEALGRVGRATGDMRGLAPIWGEGRWMGA